MFVTLSLPSMCDGPISICPGRIAAYDAAIPSGSIKQSMSGGGGSARLESDADRDQIDELGIGDEISKFHGLRQQQYRRRCEQHRARQRDDGADGAVFARMLVGIVDGKAVQLSGRSTASGAARGNVGLRRAGCIAAACAAPAWKCPNDSPNCSASASSASREPCLMFDRNHFMPTGAPHRTAGASRLAQCYIITSGIAGWVNGGPSPSRHKAQEVCDLLQRCARQG